MNKEQMLKQRLVDCVDRMQKLLALNAPASIVGAEAFSIFATTLAVYGEKAGWSFISHIREQNLASRGVCTHGEECTNEVERPGPDICHDCEKEIGIDPESMAEMLTEEEEEECDGCDGTGLMEGWNRRDGNSCPKCKGKGTVTA